MRRVSPHPCAYTLGPDNLILLLGARRTPCLQLTTAPGSHHPTPSDHLTATVATPGAAAARSPLEEALERQRAQQAAHAAAIARSLSEQQRATPADRA